MAGGGGERGGEGSPRTAAHHKVTIKNRGVEDRFHNLIFF